MLTRLRDFLFCLLANRIACTVKPDLYAEFRINKFGRVCNVTIQRDFRLASNLPKDFSQAKCVVISERRFEDMLGAIQSKTESRLVTGSEPFAVISGMLHIHSGDLQYFSLSVESFGKVSEALFDALASMRPTIADSEARK